MLERCRVDDTLAFNKEVYVRSEADVDEIWPVSSTPNVNSPKATSPPPSVFRTTARKAKRRRIHPRPLDPRPSQLHYTRPLKKLSNSRRAIRWHRGRRAREKGAYSKGLWAVPEDSVNVNTSGYEFRKHHGGWEKYVEDLEEEAENWKMDWELDEHLRENGLAHLVSAGEADDEGAGNLSENFFGVDWGVRAGNKDVVGFEWRGRV
jgi:hypothetical protein